MKIDREHIKLISHPLYCSKCKEIKKKFKIKEWISTPENTKVVLVCECGQEMVKKKW